MNNTGYILFGSLILLQISLAIKGKYTAQAAIKSKKRFYVRGIVFEVLIIALYFFLNRSLFSPLMFDQIQQGIKIDDEILLGLSSIFFIQLLVRIFSKTALEGKQMDVGMPIKFLPVNNREFAIFIIYLVSGA